MATFKTGWLLNENGEKFAPRTLMSQVSTNDGTLLEQKIETDLLNLETEINNTISTSIATEKSERQAAIATEKSERQAAIATEKSERQTEIAVERARIDKFTALGEGSTTGDAELSDIRVKVDGTTATNAGNAVREQINTLDDKIDEVDSKLSSEIANQRADLIICPFKFKKSEGCRNGRIFNSRIA